MSALPLPSAPSSGVAGASGAAGAAGLATLPPLLDPVSASVPSATILLPLIVQPPGLDFASDCQLLPEETASGVRGVTLPGMLPSPELSSPGSPGCQPGGWLSNALVLKERFAP